MRLTTQNGKMELAADLAQQVPTDIRNLSDDQFLSLGMPLLAYIRQGTAEGREVFAIHAANGDVMGLAEDPAEAFNAIFQHEMVPMTVH